MKILIQIEEFTLFLGCIYLFSRFNLKWWWFPLLLWLPDFSMVGYLYNSAVGGVLYNIVHFKGTAVAIGVYGLVKKNKTLMLIGIMLLAHDTMDRSIGAGLKYLDGFWHTSLNTNKYW